MYALPGIAPSDRFADSSLKARRSILFLQIPAGLHALPGRASISGMECKDGEE